MKLPPLKDRVGYPWQEHVWCQRCGRRYQADYRQERDWSACPVCTGEAGKPCRNLAEIQAAKEQR